MTGTKHEFWGEDISGPGLYVCLGGRKGGGGGGGRQAGAFKQEEFSKLDLEGIWGCGLEDSLMTEELWGTNSGSSRIPESLRDSGRGC